MAGLDPAILLGRQCRARMIRDCAATLPISAGPVYIFLALDHDAHFIAQSALGSLRYQCQQHDLCRGSTHCWRRTVRWR